MATLRTEDPSRKNSNAGKQERRADSGLTGQQPERPVEPGKQGISNRPGDEDPDSGVDREPGPDQTGTKEPSDRP